MKVRFFFLILPYLTFATLQSSEGGADSLIIPDIFSSGMVVQQEKPVRVWGEGDPKQSVEVEFAGERKTALFNEKRWSVEFPPQKAKGQVLSMKILSAGNLVRQIDDILVGEVWLASGQSNMDLRLCSTKECETSCLRPPDPELRCFTVSAELLKDEVKGPLGTKWESAENESIRMWSAVAYHFAYSLRNSLKIPVAIVNPSRGGTITEAWCRLKMLKEYPNYQQLLGFRKVYDPTKLQGFIPGLMFERLMLPVIPY